MINRIPPRQPNSTVHRGRDAGVSLRLVLLSVCGLVLAGGFIYAAKQHFAAVEYSYRTEELRQEYARLVEQQRRLLLTREQAVAPSRLERRAHALGMRPVSAAQIEVVKPKDRP